MEDNSKKTDKKVKKKKRSKQEKRETWAVLAILASVLIIAMVGSWITSKNINISKYSGSVSHEKQEARENARNIMIGAGVVCVGVIAVYLVKRGRRRSDEKKELEKAYMERQRIESARERVEQARMMEMLKSGQDEIKKRRGERELLGGHNADKYSLSDTDSDEDEQMSREKYMERRRREYQYYMENDDDESIEGERIEGVQREKRERKKIIFAIAGGILVIGAAALVIIFVLL